ncbi:MAG: TolC family protein [Candidatus Omnitrophota bacterium]|nr:MAG: TolC family protein [Candidatus Omnitrophota bacterium]
MKKNIIILFLICFISKEGQINAQVFNEPEKKACSIKKISIEDVSKLALENSLDIQIAKFDAYIKRTDLSKEESIFDAFINASIEYNKDKKAKLSSLLGNEIIEKTYSIDLERKLPTGTTLTLGGSNVTTKSDSSIRTMNPANEATAEISIVQELGKNFFGIADRGQIKITAIDIENAEHTSLADIEEALYDAQVAYWNFVLKVEELAITQDMYKEAEKLYEIYQKKHGLGLVEKVDLLAAEVNVKVHKNNVAEAGLQEETAKNELLFLLSESNFNLQIKPLDSLEVTPLGVDLYASLKEAIETRRDYKKVKNELKANDIDIVIKKNALWPQIDLEASYKRNGLDSNLRQAWGNVGGEDNPEIFVGLSLRIPIENREAKADFEAVSLEKQQLLFSLKRAERLILKEINNRVTQVNIIKNEVELYSAIVKLQQDKLQEEIKRLRYGRSSSDLIIRYEEDLLDARLSEAGAFYRYRVNNIGLDLDKNTLLSKYWEADNL